MPPHSLPHLLAFLAAASIFTVTPGLDTATVLRSASRGPRSGLCAAAGICTGLLAWACAAAFGLTAILAASKLAFATLKWVGALYLFYLGMKLIATPRKALAHAPQTTGDAGGSDGWDALKRGVLTNILNPKVGVFYVTFLPQFIPSGADVAGFSFLLAGLHVALTFVWFALLVALTAPIGQFLARPNVVRRFDRLTGLVFIGFGARLALERGP